MNEGLSARDRSLVQISDKLRDLRFAVRRVADLPRHGGDVHDRESAIFNMANTLANVSNRFLNTAESGLISILSTEPENHSGQAPAYGFDRYVGTLGSVAAPGGERTDGVGIRFVRDQYFAAKRVLLTCGITEALLHQERFMRTWNRCHASFGAILESPRLGHEQICRLSAIYTLGLLESNPVLSPRRFDHPHLEGSADVNLFLAATLAMVAGVTVVNEDDADSKIIYESCIAAAMARYDAIERACRQEEAEAALTTLYERLLHHLP